TSDSTTSDPTTRDSATSDSTTRDSTTSDSTTMTPPPVTPPPVTPPPTNGCPTGYTKISEQCLTCGAFAGCVKVYDIDLYKRDWAGAEALCNGDNANLFRWTSMGCYNDLNAHLRTKGYGDSMLFWSCAKTPLPYSFVCSNNLCTENFDQPPPQGNPNSDRCVLLHHKSNQETVPLPQPCHAQNYVICQRGYQ
ncbi:unnamed protein product, partial [Owenia fusiformis]